MSHIFHFRARDNGALCFLKGAPLSVTIAYDLYTDDYGNTWASSSSEKQGGLNKATGLSHSAIVDARKVLLAHHVIVKMPRGLLVKLYEGRRFAPPSNADVMHITGTITRCQDPQCTCSKILQAPCVDLYYIPTSMKTIHDPDPDPDLDSDPNIPPVGEKPKKEKRKRKEDTYFNALCEVCGKDPHRLPADTSGSVVGRVERQAKEVGWSENDIRAYGSFRKKHNRFPCNLFTLIEDMASEDWQGGSKSHSQRRAEVPEQTQLTDAERAEAVRKAKEMRHGAK